MDEIILKDNFQIFCDFNDIVLVIESKENKINVEKNGVKTYYEISLFVRYLDKNNNEHYNYTCYKDSDSVLCKLKEYIINKGAVDDFIFEDNVIIRKEYCDKEFFVIKDSLLKLNQKYLKECYNEVCLNNGLKNVECKLTTDDSRKSNLFFEGDINYQLFKIQLENDDRFIKVSNGNYDCYYNLDNILFFDKISNRDNQVIVIIYKNSDDPDSRIYFDKEEILQSEVFAIELSKKIKNRRLK